MSSLTNKALSFDDGEGKPDDTEVIDSAGESGEGDDSEDEGLPPALLIPLFLCSLQLF